MQNKKICLLLLALLIQATAQASTFDLNMSYLDPGEDASEDKIAMRNYSLNWQMPVATSEKSKTTAGINIQNTAWLMNDSRVPDVDLLKIKIPISKTWRLADRHILTARLVPGFHGESNDLKLEDYRTEAMITAAYIASAQLQWMYGLAYTDAFGQARVFPIVGTVWSPNTQWKFELVLPLFAIKYNWSSALQLKTFLQPAGGQWTTEVSDRVVDFTLSGFRTGFGADWKIPSSSFTLYASTGLEFNRKIAFEIHNSSSISRDYELENAYFFQLGLKF